MLSLTSWKLRISNLPSHLAICDPWGPHPIVYPCSSAPFMAKTGADALKVLYGAPFIAQNSPSFPIRFVLYMHLLLPTKIGTALKF